MNYTTNSALAIGVAIAMLWLAGCATATQSTETAPAANSNTATTQHDNAAAQGTYTPPDKNTPYRWSGGNAFYVQ
jgi:uncharacterized lipoprotein YajG